MRAVLLALTLIAPAAVADEPLTIGGDQYVAGAGGEDIEAPRDVFATGPILSLEGSAAGDIFAAGYDVEIEATAEDVFVMGASVEIEADIAEDLTALGGTVSLDDDATIAGNARLAGGAVIIEGEIRGALIAAAGELELDAPIGGDAYIMAGDIRFGDDAKIGGTLTYASTARIEIPDSVIPASRVVFEDISVEFGDAIPANPGSWRKERGGSGLASAAFLLIGLAFLALIAGLLFRFAGEEVEARREASTDRPGTTILFGVFAFSLLFGMIPVTAITVIGLPFIPIVALAVFLLWVLGYVLGAYFVGRRIWDAFGRAEPGLWVRIGLVAGATFVLLLLNAVPVLGWLLSLGVVFLGAGALVAALIERFMMRSDRGVAS